MRGNRERQNAVRRVHGGQIFLTPQVADVLYAGETELRERIKIPIGWCGTEIEKTERATAVGQFLFVNFQIALRQHARRLFAQRILIERKHLVVAQQVQREIVEL